jgi:hypothetical protein
MKYLTLYILVIYFCLNSLNVLSQQQDCQNSDLPDDVNELLEKVNQINNSDIINYSFTEQIGNHNIAEIYSTQISLVDMNIVAIGQYGNNNKGIVNQNGLGQEIGLFQDGNHNTAYLTVYGNNIYNVVTQVGNHNYVEHDIENSTLGSASLKAVSSEQYGNQNSITLQTAMDYSTVEVIQNGNNNNAELDLTNAGLQTDPYKIEQTGNNGEVIISHSEFYMPMQSNVQ